MKRTYALFDVVGVKDAFRQGSAADVLGKFWTAVDAWTNSGAGGASPMRIAGHNSVQVPDAYVTTFSDSAILHTEPELEISEFWKLVNSLQAAIKRAAGDSYVIVNRDDEVAHHSLPALGGSLVSGSGMRPHYINAGGSGAAFVNLFIADEAIRANGWKKYFRYAVGSDSLPPGASITDQIQFTGLGKVQFTLFACS